MGIAAETLAGVTREQWKDWVARFRPLENDYMNLTTYGATPEPLPEPNREDYRIAGTGTPTNEGRWETPGGENGQPVWIPPSIGTPAQYNEQAYQEAYQRYQNSLNPAPNSVLKDAINDATTTTGQYFKSALGQQRRSIADYGVAQDADTIASNNRTAKLTKFGSLVDAANTIRQKIIDRDRAIAFTGIQNDRQQLTQATLGQ